jgi:restriction system protein
LGAGFNLATLPWEEFEHLVRQLFEEEFRKGDAEVQVTRASSDGGVDAVILDPDPLHGGKIVIQAKRYANTVGLSAVRDLYGTVINEGANRGILVSTADYGPDAYEFVKGKPLTLLSGANLLQLLADHGHKARIDLKEAKTLNRAEKDPRAIELCHLDRITDKRPSRYAEPCRRRSSGASMLPRVLV